MRILTQKHVGFEGSPGLTWLDPPFIFKLGLLFNICLSYLKLVVARNL